jgi:protein phosphatase
MEEPIRGELTAGDQVFGVFDGMGGEERGEAAAYLAAKTIRDRPMDDGWNSLLHACREANRVICGFAASNGLHVSGTTAALLLFSPDEICSCNVGDSRIYLMREGKLRQVTRDHSMVADMVRRGLLTEEQAAVHPMRNYITRAVGTEPTVQADLYALERQAGDRWLVCSDGLHGLVAKEELERLMAGEDLEEAADEMMRLALDRGGRDNITLVLISDGEDPETSEPAELAEEPKGEVAE